MVTGALAEGVVPTLTSSDGRMVVVVRGDGGQPEQSV